MAHAHYSHQNRMSRRQCPLGFFRVNGSLKKKRCIGNVLHAIVQSSFPIGISCCLINVGKRWFSRFLVCERVKIPQDLKY